MYITEITDIKSVCLHHIGSKSKEEEVILSDTPIVLDEVSRKNLFTYCFSSFKDGETYYFYNELGLEYNEVYACVQKIFANNNSIVEQSRNLAKLLYSCCGHPSIKRGDLIVSYFADCDVNGYITDAVGIYKCENTTSFLSLNCNEREAGINTLEGFDLRHVDKAALIFNTNEDEGYVLTVIDNTNRIEAKYWVDDFLQVKPRSDDYLNTQSFLRATKSFITKQLPSDREVTKGEQAELMDKTLRYFKENETFDMADFNQQVMPDEELATGFGQFVDSYMEKNDLAPVDSFGISESAVKRSTRSMKSVIKLDRNFHIYVHGGEGLIKKGYDEATGMEYYQLFFKKEE